MLVALAAFCRCGSLNGGTNNRYVVSPLTDTLTIKLPGYENELCEVTVYGNNAHFYGTDYVGIRVGDLVADESFVKR